MSDGALRGQCESEEGKARDTKGCGERARESIYLERWTAPSGSTDDSTLNPSDYALHRLGDHQVWVKEPPSMSNRALRRIRSGAGRDRPGFERESGGCSEANGSGALHHK